MVIIKCRRYFTSLPAYLEGELEGRVNQALQKHLETCPECADRLKTLRKTIDLCQEIPLLPVPAELHNRIMENIAAGLKPKAFNLHLIIRKRKISRTGKGVENMAEREKGGLMPWDQVRELAGFRDEFDRMFDRFFRGVPSRWSESAWAPAVDIIEEENRVVVKAVLPGIDKNNLEVKVSGNILTISGTTGEEKEQKGKNYYLREVRTGSFRREISLPSEVVSDKVAAGYKNGILTITLPKVKETRAKEVKVNIE